MILLHVSRPIPNHALVTLYSLLIPSVPGVILVLNQLLLEWTMVRFLRKG
jgi:hypothetical protein